MLSSSFDTHVYTHSFQDSPQPQISWWSPPATLFEGFSCSFFTAHLDTHIPLSCKLYFLRLWSETWVGLVCSIRREGRVWSGQGVGKVLNAFVPVCGLSQEPLLGKLPALLREHTHLMSAVILMGYECLILNGDSILCPSIGFCCLLNDISHLVNWLFFWALLSGLWSDSGVLSPYNNSLGCGKI